METILRGIGGSRELAPCTRKQASDQVRPTLEASLTFGKAFIFDLSKECATLWYIGLSALICLGHYVLRFMIIVLESKKVSEDV